MVIDPELKAALLRIAIVANVIFGIFSFKAAASYAFLREILRRTAVVSKHLHVGINLRTDKTGTRGDFSLPVLWGITAALTIWYVVHPTSYFYSFGIPLSIMKASTFSWPLWASPWMIPVNVLLTTTIWWFGFIFAIILWSLPIAIVLRAISRLADTLLPRFSTTVFDVISFSLLGISGVLTYIFV